MEKEAKTLQQQWASACAATVEVCGRVTAGADLTVELAEAFKGYEAVVASQQQEIARLTAERLRKAELGRNEIARLINANAEMSALYAKANDRAEAAEASLSTLKAELEQLKQQRAFAPGEPGGWR